MKKYILVAVLFFAPFAAFAQTVPFAVDLHYGSTGSDVTALQEFLTEQNVYSGPITGNFYSLTLAGVRKFQTLEGIKPVSGYFGPISRGVADSILATQASDSEENATTTQAPVDLSLPQINVPIPVQENIGGTSKNPSVSQPVANVVSQQPVQPALILTNNIAQNTYQNSGAVLGGNCSQVVIISNIQAQFENPETHILFTGTVFPFRPQATNTVETIVVSVNGMSTSTVDVTVGGSLVEVRPAYTFTKPTSDIWDSLENGRAVSPLTGMCL